MRTEVHEASATALFGLGAPFVWREGVVFEKWHTSMDDGAETSRAYPRPDLSEAGMKSEEEADLQVDSVCFADGNHICTFLRCECHRFIAKYM